MNGQYFPRVPVNPRLEFGVPLNYVCPEGRLHQSLQDLFLKAYLSVEGDDLQDHSIRGSSRILLNVLNALRPGQKGQGSVEDRISLKSKLECGKWILAAQTPPGAPLWLLRHFLGCLPRPLLNERQWGSIAISCKLGLNNDHRKLEVSKTILGALGCLAKENYSMLSALVNLIRNLSVKENTKATLNFKTKVVIAAARAGDTIFYEEAIKALSHYFTPAIISRPYRPGLYTMLDEEHEPLLIFLSKHWVELQNHDIEELGRRNCGISHRHSISTRRSNPRYEFAAGIVDNAVDVDLRTFCIKGHYLATANAEEIDHLLLVNIEPESLMRKSDLRESRTAVASENLQIPNIIDVPIDIHTPEGVYLVPFFKQEKTTEKLQGDSKILQTCDADKSSDDRSNEFPHDYHHLKPKGINGLQERSPNLRKVQRRRDLSRRVNDDQMEVIVKVEGTQTFECDFSEDYHRSSPSRGKVASLRENNGPCEQKVDVHCTKPLVNTEKSSKTEEKCAKIPLTKSTASMLKNHLALQKDIVCFPRAAMIKLDELVPSIKNSEGLKKKSIENSSISTSSANEVQKTSKNSFKVSVPHNDFVSELKEIFIQGRRRPSDHVKIMSSHVTVSEPDVKNESSFKTSGRHTAPRLSSENFGFLADRQTVTLKSNSKEDVPEKHCVISLSANSI